MTARRVVLAVTGGIAAYKVCEVVRRLREHGVDVRVAMTRAATRFVGAHTFAALSGHRVIDDLWRDERPEEIAHVRWAEACDLFLVAPATADFLAKMAHGIADDFPSTLHLAVPGAVLAAPAMEDDMWRHAAVAANVATLRARGVQLVGPGSGALASGRSGPGRMAEPIEIVEAALRLLEGATADRWLEGRRVLVTAGPTWEALDPMRFLSNRSSGKMGYALAREAVALGAEVALISGPTALAAPLGAERVEVESAAEMHAEVTARLDTYDLVVMAAAVADFRPPERATGKIKKGDREGLDLRLERTRDILAELGARDSRPLLVGFAAETDQVEERGLDKLERKNCDLLVANRIGVEGSGAGADDNRVTILDRRGGRTEAGPAPKRVVAARIFEAVRAFLDDGRSSDA